METERREEREKGGALELWSYGRERCGGPERVYGRAGESGKYTIYSKASTSAQQLLSLTSLHCAESLWTHRGGKARRCSLTFGIFLTLKCNVM